MSEKDEVMLTNGQKMARAAFTAVKKVCAGGKYEDYKRFALSFPCLIHSCGLVQAATFAAAKGQTKYLEGLQEVLQNVETGCSDDLVKSAREADLKEYMRLSRRALEAAAWIKRCCESLDGAENGGPR